MADKERILKGIIGKLISYAHGREVTRADRPYVDAVFQSAAKQTIRSVPPFTPSWRILNLAGNKSHPI